VTAQAERRVEPQAPPPAELLLGRPEFAGDLEEAARFVRGKRVLVTGAGGSIGSPLSRLLLQAGPSELTLLDHHEYSLFTLERSLGAATHTSFELLDVRDSGRLERLFEQRRPEIVLHLAAAKHVPYGERFPEGAVATNVLATAEMLRIAQRSDVEHFVYPSSDKSVDPPSLYGATKRLVEALVQAQAGRRAWSVVRYVNIIGTHGSVIEVFSNQVRQDRPLSVTDERMTRYWISMNEALWCLLMTAQRADPGQVLMPSCGEPVPIIETARTLASWYRPTAQPYPIHIMGSRPGERLHEVLLSGNEILGEEPADGLRVVARRSPAPTSQATAALGEIGDLVAQGQRDELKRRCLALAEALQ
jgi:FlaA1/EpsC-like NDP-sugar epimerase